MRLKIAIALAILGLLVLGAGIGQRTVWLPPATLTASAPAGVAPAPLTVISPDLLKTRDGQFSMKVKSDGPIQLAVARQDDILGWIGDAAYTELGAANKEFTALSSESVKGVEQVPNPSGSDMWVSEEKGTGELSYTWQAPGHGDWALLVSSDGTAPAPTDISITADNEAGTPWAVPLMVIGSALLALAALLFILAPRKTQQAAVVPGRRAAGRVPSDPGTGAHEVDRILAARQSAKAAAPAAATSAQANTQSKSRRAGATATPVGGAASAVEGEASAKSNGAADAGARDAAEAGARNAGSKQPDTEQGDAKKRDDSKKHDADDHDSTPGTGSGSAMTGAPGAKPDSKPGRDSKGNGKNKPQGSTAPKDGGKNLSVKARWGAAFAAVLLAGSVSPALADDATTGPASPAPATTAPATGQPETAGFPNLLDSQVQRIAVSVASVAASGDNSRNAKELKSRLAGMALETRAANYTIRAKVEKEAPAEPVNATKLLAKVVSTTVTWPRSAMLVTQGENNKLPQLLTLVQASPRENYKLIKATPLLPGQTFPKVDKEGTKAVDLKAAEGLKMSPEAAIAALSDRLTKEDSKFKGTFKDSVYITSVTDLQKKVVADAKDADYVFSHKADLDTVVSFRTSDGGAMVVVGNTFGIDATSKEAATLTVGDDAAVFTGGKETSKGFTLTYAEPVVMYIPPTGGGDQLTILSANRSLIGGSFKK